MSSLIKILIVSDYLRGQGGTEQVIKKFYELFNSQSNYEVQVVLVDKECRDYNWLEGIQYVEFSAEDEIKALRNDYLFLRILMQGYLRKKIVELRKVKKMKAVIESYKPSLIISTSFQMLDLIYKARDQSASSFPIIFWDHMAYSYYMKNNKKFLSKIKYADHFFAISSGIQQSLLGLGFKEDQISLIYNPIRRRAENKYQSNSNKVIYVGRLIAEGQKRCKDILHAIKQLEHTSVELHMYGDGDDKTLLMQLSESLNIRHKVFFYGWYHEPWEIIDNIKCLILGSSYEGFGLVLAEAISYGIPCISTNCKFGPEDIVIEGVSGYFVPVDDSTAMAGAIDLIVNDRQNHQYGEGIKGTIAHLYEDNYFQRINNIIHQLIESGH